MFKFWPHIQYLLLKKPLAFLIIFFLCKDGYSQDEVTDTVYTDTAIEAPRVDVSTNEDEDSREDKKPKFDSLTASDAPSYYPYQIPDTALQNLKKDDAFWYINTVPKRQKPKEIEANKSSEPWFLKAWFRTLIWFIIIGAFVAVVVCFLIASDVRLFRRKPSVIQSPVDAEISEDIFAINYEEELDKAIANENYRLAVRLFYLHVLRLLADQNITKYKIEKTNSDYLVELYNTSYYKDFFRLTRNFEYVWYGKFDISTEAFNMIRQDYFRLKSML